MNIAQTRTTDQQSAVLAQYLRDDDLHQAKNRDDSNLRKVLLGLASELIRLRDSVNNLCEQYDPRVTEEFIDEWERTVGIPDDCIGNSGTLEERRNNVLLKIAGINITTAKQFENLAASFGFTVTVKSGVDVSTFPLAFPFVLLSAAEAPFTIIVEYDASLETESFPLTFPFTFTASAIDILECLFDKLKPANTQIVFVPV